MISYVFIPKSELTFAECYYIGTLRPRRNFGKRNSQVRYVAAEASEGQSEAIQ